MTVLAPQTEGILGAATGLVLLGAAGCATLPPPADLSAPIERILPALPSPPSAPPAGRGLVILDSVSGPSRATRVLAPLPSAVPAGVSFRRAGDQGSTLLCAATPCAAYLPYGTQEVLLESNVDTDRQATYLLDVTDRPLVLRASLDANLSAGRGRVAGAVLLVSGLASMAIGLTMVANNEEERSNQGLAVASWSALGVGAAVALIGGILWSHNAPVHYEGHAIQWNLEQGAIPAAPVPPRP